MSCTTLPPIRLGAMLVVLGCRQLIRLGAILVVLRCRQFVYPRNELYYVATNSIIRVIRCTTLPPIRLSA